MVPANVFCFYSTICLLKFNWFILLYVPILFVDTLLTHSEGEKKLIEKKVETQRPKKDYFMTTKVKISILRTNRRPRISCSGKLK